MISRDVPDYRSKGEISKKELLKADEVIAMMKNFDFDLKFEVMRFSVSATIGGLVKDGLSTSNKITNQQKEIIKQLKKGDKIYFEDIKCKGPDGSVRNLSPMVFTISGE